MNTEKQLHKERLIEQLKNLRGCSKDPTYQARVDMFIEEHNRQVNANFWNSIKPQQTRWQKFIAWLNGR